YSVKTYHSENYWGLHGRVGPKKRIFSISLEGNVVKSNVDLYALNKNAGSVFTFSNVQVKDGKLNLQLKASVNNSVISGLSLVKQVTVVSPEQPPSTPSNPQ